MATSTFRSVSLISQLYRQHQKCDFLTFYCQIWFNSSTFLTYSNWKSIVKNKVRGKDSSLWLEFCSGHPNMHVALSCLEKVSPPKFSSLADLYLDLVSRLHIQVRLMGNLCLNGGIPWLFNTMGSLCFICRKKTQKRYIITLLIVPFLGIIIALCGLT